MAKMYWTAPSRVPTVQPPTQRSAVQRLFCLFLMFFSAAASAQQAPAVSADAAARAVARGAVVVDLRAAADYQAGHLPGAVALDAAALLQERDALQAVVSRHGIDLSREVIVLGQPGDLLAQQVQAHLLAYASGRVSWFVGGVVEWQLSGRPLHTGTTSRAPVPQYLVRFTPAADAGARMAAATLRDTGPVPATGQATLASRSAL